MRISDWSSDVCSSDLQGKSYQQALAAARAEHAFLGAGRLLVAADAGDHAIQVVFRDGFLQAQRLARGDARGVRQSRVGRLDLRAGTLAQVEAPFRAVTVAEGLGSGAFQSGIEKIRRGEGRERGGK